MTEIRMTQKIELWKTGSLRPYSRNPRRHTREGVAQIAASISRFGFRAPILVDAATRTIVAGHGRLQAAELLGLEEVPVVPIEDMTEEERRAYVIADNRLTELSDWDDALLSSELESLGAENLEALGFSDEELADLGVGDDLEDEEEEEDPAGLRLEDFGAGTAMTRRSVPMTYWRKAGLIAGDVLDYGCGHDDNGCARWDPFSSPDPAPLLRTWDRVLVNYVLNVQPAEHLVTMTAALVHHLTKPRGGRALFAIRNDLELGVHRSPRGIQVGRTESEWRALLVPFFELEVCDTPKFLGYVARRRKASPK